MPTELSPEEIARSHRWHAVGCNNLAWKLCDQPGRTPIQDEKKLHAASVAGDAALHRQHHAKALELGRAITDPEDKEVFFNTFNTIPSA